MNAYADSYLSASIAKSSTSMITKGLCANAKVNIHSAAVKNDTSAASQTCRCVTNDKINVPLS